MKKTIVVVLVMCALVVTSSIWAQGPSLKAPTVSVSSVSLFETSSTLRRTNNAVKFKIVTNSLQPGYVYTVWAVFFNDPTACATTPCRLADLGTAQVNASIRWSGAGRQSSTAGTTTFQGRLVEGDTANALFGPGLVDSRAAEIHFIVRSHGPVIPELLQEQLSTLNGGCEVNECADVQFSVHLPG